VVARPKGGRQIRTGEGLMVVMGGDLGGGDGGYWEEGMVVVVDLGGGEEKVEVVLGG